MKQKIQAGRKYRVVTAQHESKCFGGEPVVVQTVSETSIRASLPSEVVDLYFEIENDTVFYSDPLGTARRAVRFKDHGSDR